MNATPENHLHEEDPRWFAVYTAFKKEKYAAEQLVKKGITTYLPLRKVVRRYERKVKKLQIPLINCYVFVKITKAEYVSVLETEYIYRFIKFSNNLISIPDEEIEILRKVLGENIDVSAEATQLLKGDLVEINNGNLLGMRGKLVDFKGKNKVVIELENLGYSLHLELEKEVLEKVTSQI